MLSALLTLGILPFCAALSLTNTMIVDHYNYNHRKGDHALLSAFYFDLLGFAADPRKTENLEAGKGTVWANAGAHQLHLAEGKPDAQPLDGVITLGYRSLEGVRARLANGVSDALAASQFSAQPLACGSLAVTDPWGAVGFKLIDGVDDDVRSRQDAADDAEVRCIVDLTFHLPSGTPASRLAGIGRFYERVLGCQVLRCDDKRVVIATGGPPRADGSPLQTLTYALCERAEVEHAEVGVDGEGRPQNHGAHISLYLQDLRAAYRRAKALGITYVNHRFKRRAYTEEEAVEQCMFRTLDVVDPDDVAAGPILQLEHEVRSATKADGSKYKSCPLELAE